MIWETELNTSNCFKNFQVRTAMFVKHQLSNLRHRSIGRHANRTIEHTWVHANDRRDRPQARVVRTVINVVCGLQALDRSEAILNTRMHDLSILFAPPHAPDCRCRCCCRRRFQNDCFASRSNLRPTRSGLCCRRVLHWGGGTELVKLMFYERRIQQIIILVYWHKHDFCNQNVPTIGVCCPWTGFCCW